VRVVVVDTGGGFGIKGHAYSEDVIVTAAARGSSGGEVGRVPA